MDGHCGEAAAATPPRGPAGRLAPPSRPPGCISDKWTSPHAPREQAELLLPPVPAFPAEMAAGGGGKGKANRQEQSWQGEWWPLRRGPAASAGCSAAGCPPAACAARGGHDDRADGGHGRGADGNDGRDQLLCVGERQRSL